MTESRSFVFFFIHSFFSFHLFNQSKKRPVVIPRAPEANAPAVLQLQSPLNPARQFAIHVNSVTYRVPIVSAVALAPRDLPYNRALALTACPGSTNRDKLNKSVCLVDLDFTVPSRKLSRGLLVKNVFIVEMITTRYLLSALRDFSVLKTRQLR